ncbi:MAG: hypothetical protein K2F52_00845, partial [Malacoplasma sp.]|nr:hypothetical protein [Malacoplasma sp.]
MKKLKWIKGLVLSSFVGLTAVSLVACGPTVSATHAFTNSPTNFLTDNNSPLNGSFNNSPISTYAQTSLYSLTTYQTTGQFVPSESGGFSKTTEDTLILEGASAVLVFKDETVMKDVDSKLDPNLLTEKGISQDEILTKLKDIKTNVDKSTTTTPEQESNQDTKADEVTTDNKWTEGTDYWVFTRDKGGIQFQKGLDAEPDANVSEYYNNAVSKGKTYQFIIDTNNYWVDENGTKKQAVSSKDFERGLEAYALSAGIGYTRNGYFLDLIGLGENGLGKTIGYQKDNKYVNPQDKNYDINNFANQNDAVYTMYIDEEYPYTLDLISKEYFGALPYTNEKVKNISLSSGKIAVDNSGKINESNTKWEEIFGSGGLNKFTENTWYAGAYYVSAFTGSQIIFKLNSIYMDTVGQNLLSYEDGKILTDKNPNKDKRMEEVVINYGTGTADTYFENYKAGQIDYLSSVPEAKRNEARNVSGVTPIKVIQTTQSNYIAYTPHPYVVDKDGKIVANTNVPTTMADFIYQWDSKDATIIRAGIAGLINYYQLSSMVYSNSRDFQLSATPYGAFKNYYENVAKGKIYGALPITYNKYQESESDILSDEFEIPYYSYEAATSDTDTSDGKVNIEKIKINQNTFKEAINNFLKSDPNSSLSFSIKFGEGSWSVNYQNYLTKWQETVQNLSGNKIKVTLNQRLGPNPTSNEWYNSQSSPLGFSYWSPDYNGVGTWIEADTTLESTKVGDKTYEGVPSTNSHNSFHTYLQAMVYAVKLMNYKWNDTSKKYEADTTATSTNPATDPYANDDRIQKAFSNDTLADFGIQTTDSSFDNKTTPGERYGVIAISLLNMMIEKGVFDQTALTKYINDPTQLKYQNNAPKDVQSIYLGGDVIKAGQSANFSKYLGIFAGE